MFQENVFRILWRTQELFSQCYQGTNWKSLNTQYQKTLKQNIYQKVENSQFNTFEFSLFCNHEKQFCLKQNRGFSYQGFIPIRIQQQILNKHENC
ncbi:unnamed protein product [Paramecium sonneborni]|uniref:Uncharacterized protein n=1 Tax=Paramecium sonneborni TaxID=65129 RepID=A0A8S1M0N8_9CILI|nr:unnamed protein product [Paramecium sonneborni]